MAELRAYLRPPFAWCCCAALAVLGGCRNLDNAQTDVLERELRQQEDYIYELEDYLIEYSEKLRQARLAQCPPTSTSTSTRPTTSKGTLPNPTIDEDLPTRPSLPLNGRHKIIPPATAPLTDAPPASTLTAPPVTAPPVETPAAETPAAEAPAATTPAAPEPASPEDLEAPPLEVGPVGALEAPPGTQVAGGLPSPANEGDAGPLLIPDPVDYQADNNETPDLAAPSPVSSSTEEAPQLAGPQNLAPRLTAQQLEIRRVFSEPNKEDEAKRSLLVVVEAVNATNEPVEALGAASLMIMAPDETGALTRVERWDFTAEETAAAWQSSHLGDGLHLELPLENRDLPEGELQLWARVVAGDGVKLLTSADAPYRFEATKLVSMAEANSDTALAASPAPQGRAAAPSEAEAPALASTSADQGEETPESEKPPQPQWRASSVRLDKDLAEGLATTAGAKPAAWSTTSSPSQPRVASAAGKNEAPTWKRSTRAATSTESAPEWSANR